MPSVLSTEPLRDLPSSPTPFRVLRALTVETAILRTVPAVEIAALDVPDARRFVFRADLVRPLSERVGEVVTIGPDGVTS